MSMQLGIGIGVGFGNNAGVSFPLDYSSTESKFNLPSQDASGFSVFTPSSDSRIMYVSDTSGNDGTAAYYAPADSEVGSDPFNPDGPVDAYKTINAALADARAGYPDYVLLERGDTFTVTSKITVKLGRSVSERSLIGAYGSGNRPVIEASGGNITTAMLSVPYTVDYAAVSSLRVYDPLRDPDHVDFVGFGSTHEQQGLRIQPFVGGANKGVLIEDCWFDYMSINQVDANDSATDIIIRRCQFTNTYSEIAHAQGLFADDSSILLEDCFFDHNGWLTQQVATGNDKEEGQGTIFNHNVYFGNMTDTIIRGNVFSRASSMGVKLTANPASSPDVVMSRNVLMENNLFIRGEIGVSAGGNNDFGTGYRWSRMSVRDNVFTEIGADQPTNRAIGWGVNISDWESGEMTNNVLSGYGDALNVTNSEAVSIEGHNGTVLIDLNIAYGIEGDTNAHAVRIDSDPKSSVTFSNNELQFPSAANMKHIDTDSTSVTFTDNTYDTGTIGDAWEVSGVTKNFTGWQAAVSSSGEAESAVVYTDAGRDITDYMTSLAYTATLEEYVARCTASHKDSWDADLLASAVNDYIRAGYGR